MLFAGLKVDRSKCPCLHKRIGQMSWSNKTNRTFQNSYDCNHCLELHIAQRVLMSIILQVEKARRGGGSCGQVKFALV